MAKTAKLATNGTFAIETGVELPAVVRIGGAKGSSPYLDAINGLQLATDPKKLQSFFIPAEIADNITDETEKAKAYKEASRKIANRVSGLSRRLAKADATKAYAIRTMVKDGVTGVRVFRVKPEPKAPAAAA